jgi:uncharacterized protein (DUF362 family)
MPKKISRRSFMKQSAAIGASTIIAPSLISSTPSAHGEDAISVVEGDDYYSNTIKAVEALGGMGHFVSAGKKVAILANPQRNNPGAFTKPPLVAAVIEMCREAGAAEVACISWLPAQNWKATGLTKVVEDGGAKLTVVDSKDESLFTPVPVPMGKALKEARVMNELSKYDVLIDMPITKDHAGNKFTGTMKNLMGLNSPKSNRTFHKEDWQTNIDSITHLDQCIADLNTVIASDLCVVDATEFIITNGPFGPGEIHKPKKIVAGTDRVAIDSYCCTLWDLEPKDIIMIVKAHEHGIGEMDLGKIHVNELKG